MSFYFTIQSEKEITYRQLINELPLENIEFGHLEDIDDYIGENNYKAFIKNKSTRGVNLSHREQNYSVSLNVIASEADFEIALLIVEALSKLTEAEILPEDRETPIDIVTFRNHYDKNWIEEEKYLGVSIFLDKIGNEGDTLEIACCYMSYLVGPDIHKKLDAGSEKSYYEGLVSYISSTQFWDREKYHIPSIIRFTDKDTGEDKELVLLYQNGNQFLSKADEVVLSDGESRIKIPYDKIKLLATEKFHLVDEKQYVVDELTDEEYKNIYLKAVEISSVNKAENTTKPESEIKAQKKWWEFWK